MPKKKHKESKKFRQELEKFVESVVGESDIIIKDVDLYITYEATNGDVKRIGNSIYEFEEGD